MFSLRRDSLQILLSVLLTVALCLAARADLKPDPASDGKDLQLHQEVQLAMSAPMLDLKTGARKEASPWSACVARGQEDDSAARPRSVWVRLDHVVSARMPLSDLRALRGRAPPQSQLA